MFKEKYDLLLRIVSGQDIEALQDRIGRHELDWNENFNRLNKPVALVIDESEALGLLISHNSWKQWNFTGIKGDHGQWFLSVLTSILDGKELSTQDIQNPCQDNFNEKAKQLFLEGCQSYLNEDQNLGMAKLNQSILMAQANWLITLSLMGHALGQFLQGDLSSCLVTIKKAMQSTTDLANPLRDSFEANLVILTLLVYIEDNNRTAFSAVLQDYQESVVPKVTAATYGHRFRLFAIYESIGDELTDEHLIELSSIKQCYVKMPSVFMEEFRFVITKIAERIDHQSINLLISDQIS